MKQLQKGSNNWPEQSSQVIAIFKNGGGGLDFVIFFFMKAE